MIDWLVETSEMAPTLRNERDERVYCNHRGFGSYMGRACRPAWPLGLDLSGGWGPGEIAVPPLSYLSLTSSLLLFYC